MNRAACSRLCCLVVGLLAVCTLRGKEPSEQTHRPPSADAWQALSIGQYADAIDLFHAAGASRETQLGLAIAQLNRPPITPSSLAEAQRQLEALAGDDTLGHAARYFLGRLRQNHPMTPDPAAAARDYEGLVATGADDTWTRLALVKLAILRLTVLRHSGALPDQLAAVEPLLARTSDLATLHDLHLVIAEARLNHEIYDANTLGHLRAALAMTRESDTMRADILVQIGRLASMLGERDVAREHYERFLHDYPKERRYYTVSMALAHLGGPFPAMKRQRINVFIGIALLAAAYVASLFYVIRLRRPTSGPQPKVVLRFAHWQLESGMREAFDFIAQQYMKLHPEVRVEQFAVPGRVYRQWLSTQLAAGTIPDLVSFNSTDQSDVAQLPRNFQPITRWVNEPNPYNAGTSLAGVPWRLTFLDGGRNRATYVDQYRNYYAVGLSTHSMRIFYNKNLLRAITGSDEPPRDFRAWLELGRKVRAYRPGLIPIAGAHDNATWFTPVLINQAMTKWILSGDRELRFATTALDFYTDMLAGRWNLRSPPMQTSLRIMKAFGAEMTPGFLQLDRDSAIRAFLRGEAFSVPDGTWDYPTMREAAKFPIGAFRLPLPTADDAEFGGYTMLPISDGGASTAMPFYLSRQSRHPEVAIDFLRYVTSMEGNRLFSHASHWMPSIEGVEVEPELQPFKQQNNGYVVTDSQNGPQLLYGPGAAYTQLFATHLHVLYEPDGGVEAYTRALEPQFREVVETDLRKQAHVQRENIRQRDVALAALDFLGPAEQAESVRQQSSQHLNEIHVYLLEETLAAARPRP